jgi:serine/threonine protein kinase
LKVKIADFGVASYVESDEMCRTFVGSIGYMSMERLLGQQYSYNSDIWSLGVTLFTCATGRNPFLEPGKESGEFWSVLKNIQVQRGQGCFIGHKLSFLIQTTS